MSGPKPLLAPDLRCPRALVRLPQRSDAASIAAYLERNAQRYDPPLLAQSTHKQYWEREVLTILQELRAGSAVRAFVFDPMDGKTIGSLSLHRIQRGLRHDATLSFAIDAPLEGRGIMGEAARAFVDYAFSSLELHRLEATHRSSNHRSQALLQRLGFERVGVIRQLVWCDTAWIDGILWSLVNPHPAKGQP